MVQGCSKGRQFTGSSRHEGQRTPSPVSRRGILVRSFSLITTERAPPTPWKRAVGFVRRTSTRRSGTARGRRQPFPSLTLSAIESKSATSS